MKYFYSKNNFDKFKSNLLFREIVEMNDSEFEEWAKLLRLEVKTQWDNDNIPPVIGKTENGIIASLSKLRNNYTDILQSDSDSLGILQNFNKDAAVINQFFPTMLKTKISVGKSAEGGLSIYDYFGEPDMENIFISTMKRAVKRDSMYNWSRSLVNKRDENPFWNGQSAHEFIKQVGDGKIFNGVYENYDLFLTKAKDSTFDNYGTFNDEYVNFGNLYLTADEVNDLLDTGYLQKWQIANCGNIESARTSKTGNVTKYMYAIRYFNKLERIFPTMLRVIRLSCGQAAVNFPALTARWIYEKYTDHINTDDVLVIYDSSAGWGGRIMGAMSSHRKFHYVGTDPNPDNFIPELNKTRYEYLAEYYNKHCVDNHSDTLQSFFEVETAANTYHVFRDGSELIHLNPDFQKYKGKLDLAFTSPPYFNREQYSQDDKQSFVAYYEYENWRDNFLRQTIKTISEYLNPNRYALWNIASIKIGKDDYYPLEEDSIGFFEEFGFHYKGKLKMLLTRMPGLDPSKSGVKNAVKFNGKWYKYEPIFVFYKS